MWPTDTCAGTSTMPGVYYVWVTSTAAMANPTVYYHTPRQPTRAEQEAWLADQRRDQARQLEKHSEEARERAMELLLTSLSPAQRETFQKNRWFVVEGSKSGKKYRIHANDNVAANIEVLDGERVSHRLCGHCDINKIPLGDQLLAQKLTLEFAEDDFLRIANKHHAAA